MLQITKAQMAPMATGRNQNAMATAIMIQMIQQLVLEPLLLAVVSGQCSLRLLHHLGAWYWKAAENTGVEGIPFATANLDAGDNGAAVWKRR